MKIKLNDPEHSVRKFLYLAATDQDFYEAFVKHATEAVGTREIKIKAARVTLDGNGNNDPTTY